MEKGSLDYQDVLHTKKKIVLLRPVHKKVLWRTKKFAWQNPLSEPIFLRVKDGSTKAAKTMVTFPAHL